MKCPQCGRKMKGDWPDKEVYFNCEFCGDRFVIEDDGVYAVWSNEYLGDGLSQMQLDFFVEQDDGLYERMDDCIQERAYSDEMITNMLENAGFCVVGRYDFDTLNDVKNDSEKIIYVAQRNDWSL